MDYDPSQEPVFERIRDAIRRTGNRERPEDLDDQENGYGSPMGGARLGAGPDRGVVDHLGEVYGNPGLFIADGAVLPAAVGTPPSLAIAAWAHHVADSLALRLTSGSL